MKNLDRYAAVAGYILIIASIVVLKVKDFHPIYMVAAVIGLLAVTAYFLCRDRLAVDTKLSNGYGLFGIFVALSYLVIALFIFLIRPNQYEKPLPYYIFVAVAVGILFYLAVYESRKWRIYAILVLACGIGLMHIWTETLMFSGLIGIDPWSHLRIVTSELDRVKDWTYIGGYYTAFHFYLRWVMDLTGLDYRMAALIFVGSLTMVGNVVFSFLIGKELFNIKVGVVAALMLSCANWNITFSEWIIPNGIGATFALAAAYLLIRMWYRPNPILIVLLFPILVLSYFTHMIAMVWTVGTVICLFTIPILLEPKPIKEKLITLAKVSIVPVSLVLTVVGWLIFSTNGNALYDTAGASNFNPAFGMTYAIGKAPVFEGQAVTVVVQDSLKLFEEMVINSIGMLLFVGIALIGVLMMLRRNRFNITYTILCVTVLAIGFFPPLFGFSLIEMRWWYLAQCLMAVPLGAALVYLTGKKTALIMSVIVAGIVFLNIIGLMSNNTQRALSPNQTVRYGLTDREMAGLIVAESDNPKMIGADSYYLSYVLGNEKHFGYGKNIGLEKYIFSGDFRDCPADVLLIRDSLYKEPFGYGGGTIYKLDFNPADIAARQGYQLVYSNGDIQCLIRNTK